jgi:hypothetical protein
VSETEEAIERVREDREAWKEASFAAIRRVSALESRITILEKALREIRAVEQELADNAKRADDPVARLLWNAAAELVHRALSLTTEEIERP